VKRILTLMTFILLLFIVNTVFAQEDFSLFSQSQELNVCSCSSQTNFITIQNIGDFVSIYTIQVSGSGEKFVNQLPQSFTLGPGASRTLSQVFSIPCGVTGEFFVNIKVSTTSGVAKEFTQKIIAKTCNPIQVYTKNLSQEINPCEKVKFDLILENIAPYSEVYEISAINKKEYTNSFLPIRLNPNQRATIPIEYEFSCDKHGFFELPFSIYATNTQVEVIIPFNLTIKSDYRFGVKIPDISSQCTEFKEDYKLTITNNFNKQNNYTINLKAPRFIGLDKEFLSLEVGQSESINLIVDPRKSDDLLGLYNITVIIEEQIGKTKKEIPLKISLEDCYSIGLDLKVVRSRVCGQEKKFDLNIENLGKAETVEIYFDKDYSFLSLENSVFELDEKDKEHTFIVFNPENAKPGNYKIGVIASLQTSNSSTLEKKYFDLEILPEEKCYDLDVKNYKQFVENSNSFIPIKIRNTGFYTQNIFLNLENDNFSLSENNLVLDENQEKLITVKLNNLSVGNYLVPLKIFDTQNNTICEHTVKINLREKNTLLKTYIFVLSLVFLIGIIFSIKSNKKNIKILNKLHLIKFISIILLLVVLFLTKNKLSIISIYFEYILLFLLAGISYLCAFYITKNISKKTSKIKINYKKLKKFIFILLGLILLGLFIFLIIFFPQYIDYALLALGILFLILIIIKIIKIKKLKREIGVIEKKPNVKKVKSKEKKSFLLFEKIKQNKSRILKSVLVLLLISLFLFVTYTTFDVNNKSSEKIQDSFLDQIIYEGETKKLDLTDYFSDPDNDTLYFSATSNNNLVDLEVKNDILLIKGLIEGNDTIKIIIDDLKGGLVESPDVKIQVLPKRFNFYERLILGITDTFGTINFVLALLVIFLVGIVIIKFNKKQENKSKVIVVKKTVKKQNKSKKRK